MTNVQRETERVMQAAAREAEVMRDGDMNGYLALLCDDAVFMPPNLPALKGRELRTWLLEFLDNNAIEWPRFEHGETMIAGDLAFHEYLYAMKVTPKASGQATTGFGKGMQVLRREPGGSWRILRNIWNARPADTVL